MLQSTGKQMTKAAVRQRGPHVLVPAVALVTACCVIYANRAAFTTAKLEVPSEEAHTAVTRTVMRLVWCPAPASPQCKEAVLV